MTAGADVTLEPCWRAVLDFWFLPADHPSYGAFRREWFTKDPAFDDEIRRRFADEVDMAATGKLDDLARHARGALALIILLDQLPRNLFRGTPRAFAADARAREIADRAVRAGFDRALSAVQRVFVYLPFEHCETLADQDRCAALFADLPAANWRAEAIEAGRRHREIIARFGRFPHRNEILGRPSTPEEIAFLREPRSSF